MLNSTISELIYPAFTGLAVSVTIVVLRQGWIQAIFKWYLNEYKRLDSEGVILNWLIIITSPFIAIYIYYTYQSSETDIVSNISLTFNKIKNTPLSNIPFQSLATGLGIILGNTVINWLKNKDEKKETITNMQLAIEEQLLYLETIHALIKKDLLEDFLTINEKEYSIRNQIQYIILIIKTSELYKYIYTQRNKIPKELAGLVNDYITNLNITILLIEQNFPLLEGIKKEQNRITKSLEEITTDLIKKKGETGKKEIEDFISRNKIKKINGKITTKNAQSTLSRTIKEVEGKVRDCIIKGTKILIHIENKKKNKNELEKYIEEINNLENNSFKALDG